MITCCNSAYAYRTGVHYSFEQGLRVLPNFTPLFRDLNTTFPVTEGLTVFQATVIQTSKGFPSFLSHFAKPKYT